MWGSLFNYVTSLQPLTLLKIITFGDIIQEVRLPFGKSYCKE